MPILRAQAYIPFFTGIPRDVLTNTIHFEWDGTGTLALAADEIATRMDEFYEEVYLPTAHAASYMVWEGAYIEVTNLAAPTPRIPEVRLIPIGVSESNSGIPTEVAVVMTYAAAETGGVIRQRLYNRIYLGGLGNAAIADGTASTFPTVAVGFRDAVALAAEQLQDHNDGAIDWIQYSPTSETARPIVRGWIDNSPDTQRRRSVDETARTAINFVP